MRSRSRHVIHATIIVGLSAAVAVAQPATTKPVETQPALDPEVDRVLTRLEKRQVHDLRAHLVWRQRYLIDREEDAVSKRGQIWYQEGKPVAKFLIQFSEKIAGQRRDQLDERYLFDGQWYVEFQARSKTITRREIRKPDDPSDPYKVGEGVFPMPFGQKKADILREFEVAHVKSAEGDPARSDHIRLIPRADTKTRQTYKTLDFWVSQEGPTAGLPIKVQVAKKDGTGRVNSYITMTFGDVRLNEGFSGSIFDIEVPAGYQEIVERLEPIPPPAGEPAP